jgi:hypothetical protein
MIFVFPAARRFFKRGKLFATPQFSFESLDDEARAMLLTGNFIDSGGDSLGNRNHRSGCAHNLSLDDGGIGCGPGWRSAPDSVS